jgi:hypothetical protein
MLPSFTENLSELRSLVAQIHGMVLCISSRMAMSQLLPHHLLWVIYIHTSAVCEQHRWLQPGRVPAAEQHVHPAV